VAEQFECRGARSDDIDPTRDPTNLAAEVVRAPGLVPDDQDMPWYQAWIGSRV
jgi:hypothetical protein